VSYKSATEEYYEKQAQAFFDNTLSSKVAPHRERFLRHLPKGTHILDAGCGSGRDTLAFLQDGYEVVSFDASKELVKLSTQLTGQTTLQLRFQEIDFSNQFDGIWASASLIHVPYDELREVLERLQCALKDGGILYASLKKGDHMREADGREFYDHNQEKLQPFIEGLFEQKEEWYNEDTNIVASSEKLWYHVLLKKVAI